MVSCTVNGTVKRNIHKYLMVSLLDMKTFQWVKEESLREDIKKTHQSDTKNSFSSPLDIFWFKILFPYSKHNELPSPELNKRKPPCSCRPSTCIFYASERCRHTQFLPVKHSGKHLKAQSYEEQTTQGAEFPYFNDGKRNNFF